MKSYIQEIKEQYGHHCYFCSIGATCQEEEDAGVVVCKPDMFVWFATKFIIQDIYNRLISKVCDIKGHRLVDESSGGPESGNMDHSCNRCGCFWSVPLY